ncbi:hypothetical protein [Streptosporangium sp. CA-115845]|uniref:hypothetical protein n=1 Tax=Streptosporangium sp. CA-115845 TaxID=3240071 RepID=UPI003D8B71D7
MPTKGNPRQAFRFAPELWEDFKKACADEGTTPTEDVRTHVEKKVRAWRRRRAQADNGETAE